MATKPRTIRPEPKGDFDSRFVTLRKCKSFAGGNYTLCGAERIGDSWRDFVKSSTGAGDWFEHSTVMAALTGYWNAPEPPIEPVAKEAPHVAKHQVNADLDL